MIRTLLRDDIAVSFELQSAPLHVCCDRGELERALLNLVVNAREAMPAGGTVTIRSRRVVGGEEGPAPAALVISVIDDGCGMDAETKGRAFEPFFSRKPENTGLGLAMVYGLIQQSGGQIELESEEGRGTAIHISLPVAEPVASPPCEEPLDRLARRTTVLVVEDDPLVRLTLRGQLESSGCELIEASDSAAALSSCEHRLAGLDLLITDVVLPGLSGPQLAHELRERRPELPVIYISAYAPETLRQEGRIGPGETSLQKPFDRAALLAAIREALGGP
jgi:CheY-like chemotaxis protein